MQTTQTDTHANTYLEGIKKHDPMVLKTIFKEFQPGIIKFISSNQGTKADAEDIFMDALEAIFRRIKADNLVLTCTFGTFLFEICKRLWWKKLRRKKFDAGVTPDDRVVSNIVDEVKEALEQTERYKLYLEKLERLGADCRKLLLLFYSENQSMVEIAAAMSYGSEGYARKRKFECKEKLVQFIKGDSRYNELL